MLWVLFRMNNLDGAILMRAPKTLFFYGEMTNIILKLSSLSSDIHLICLSEIFFVRDHVRNIVFNLLLKEFGNI